MFLEEKIEARDAEMLDRGKVGNPYVRAVICSYVTERICQGAVAFAAFYDAS